MNHPLPKNIGPYKVLDHLGRGGFSEVFRVERGGKIFALKKLHDHLKYDSEYNSLLENEIQLLTQVQGDTRFPKLIEGGVHQDSQFLVMEYIDGFNLEIFTEKKNGPPLELPDLFCVQLIFELTQGLQSIHRLKIFLDRRTVHGDIRPSNVMLTRRGNLKIIDLGLKGGTFDFMPLERLHDKIFSPYTDIYALGHLLFELTHRHPLFKAKTKLDAYEEMRMKEIKEEIFRPNLAKPIKTILVKCLNQEEGCHYLEVGPLLKDLQSYLKFEGIKNSEFKSWVKKIFQNNFSPT